MKMFTSLTAYLYVFTLRYIFRTTKPLKQGMESLQTCVKWIASTFPLHMHTIAPLKENVALDITHAVGVEKLDREEREVKYILIKYPLMNVLLSYVPLFLFDSCPLLKRVYTAYLQAVVHLLPLLAMLPVSFSTRGILAVQTAASFRIQETEEWKASPCRS